MAHQAPSPCFNTCWHRFAPRKSGQQFLPLNRGVRWADIRKWRPPAPNGHIISTAKTADRTFSVPTVAHGHGLEIPHPHPCRMTCMTYPLDQVTVGCLTVLLLLNCLVTYRGSILFDWRLRGFLKRLRDRALDSIRWPLSPSSI